MKMMMCTRCKKRPAVMYISTISGTERKNEGLCLPCAKEMGLPQVLDYLIAVLALECEDTDTAGRMISSLLSERNLSPRISQRIPELKDMFHELKNNVEGE